MSDTRTLKVGRTYQSRARGSEMVVVPLIRLCGKWLADAGFTKGTVIHVTLSKEGIKLVPKVLPVRKEEQAEFF